MTTRHYSIFTSRIFWKLFLAITLVILVSLLIAYFYLTPLLSRFLFSQIEQTLVEKARLICDRLEVLSPADWNTFTIDTLTDRIAKQINTRVTIVDQSGRVLGESNLSGLALQQMENHLHRPEVQASLTKPFGTRTRYSTTIKKRMLYVAVRMPQGFARVALPLTAIDQMVGEIKRSILLSALVALALSSMIGLFISRLATRTIREISAVARQTAKGDFSKRLLSTKKSDELADLCHSINEMGISLEKQFSQLKNEKNRLMTVLNAMVEGVLVTNEKGTIILINPALKSMLCLEEACLDKSFIECFRNEAIHNSIQEVLNHGKAVENEMRVFVGQDEKFLIIHGALLQTGKICEGSVSVFYDVTRIRKLENMRREFVANVSHELKTPLTNIKGYAETLSEGAINDREVAKSFVAKIEKGASQLQNLVEDILQLSEIESGRVEKQLVPIDLQSFVEEERIHFETAMKKKRLFFHNRVPNTLRVQADPKGLGQIFSNLLDNAIKYTEEEGTITVGAETMDSTCRVTISDTGMGIPKEDLPHIFERFYRVDKARSRDLGGTGLGLAIVKHWVLTFGGQVFVTSEQGKGSIFSFTLSLHEEST